MLMPPLCAFVTSCAIVTPFAVPDSITEFPVNVLPLTLAPFSAPATPKFPVESTENTVPPVGADCKPNTVSLIP